jgi:hypothetical protein
MPKNFKIGDWGASGQANRKTVVRSVLGTLLVLNLIALQQVIWPWGGSAEDLEKQMASLHGQVRAREQQLARARVIASKVEAGRGEAEKFLNQYFLEQRTAAQSIVTELVTSAKKAQIGPREHSYNIEPIEGSDTLSVMTVTGSYEGTYADLMSFISVIDRSDRLLIIDSLNASPQQGGQRLAVQMKMNAFVREPALTLGGAPAQ